MTTEPTALTKMREPFPKTDIDHLPKQMARDDKDKGSCVKGSKYSADGVFCGGWHARSLHIDYVGHAALTARLLEADMGWSWEPVASDDSGLPKFDMDGGLWIRLTVGGQTRLGYGSADGKKGGNATKEIIGDALRNAAMRFGAALDLWKKGDKREAEQQRGQQPTPGVAVSDATVNEWVETLTAADSLKQLALLWSEAGKAGAQGNARVLKAKDDRKKTLNKDPVQ